MPADYLHLVAGVVQVVQGKDQLGRVDVETDGHVVWQRWLEVLLKSYIITVITPQQTHQIEEFQRVKTL